MSRQLDLEIIPSLPPGLQAAEKGPIVVTMPRENRDYAADMNELFAQFTKDDSYNLRDVAIRIVEHCQQNDRDLLNGWLDIQAGDLIWGALLRKENSQRALSIRSTKHAVFQEALREAANGNPAPAQEYVSILDGRFTTPSKVRKRYSAMNREEVEYLASRYGHMEKRSQLHRIFHETVARALGEGEMVGDKFDATRLYEIQQNLGLTD